VTAFDEPIVRGSVSPLAKDLTRGEFFAGLFALGCANGLASRAIQSVHRHGWVEALLGTFEISVVVLISCIAGVSLVLQDRTIAIRPSELALGAAFVLLVILPIGPVSWLAVAALSLYIINTTNVSSARRGALILLAVTVPMLWSRLFFHFFAELILRVDASLVAWILHTHRTGDIVEFADGSGVLVILPACSSLANVSLALLCWVTVSQLVSHKNTAYDLFWSLMACVSVVAVNVTRISFMGLSQSHYAMFHSSWGDAVANTTILGLIVGFSLLGVRRELFQRI
jgi:exosortase/archaeosortase family protein